VDEGLREQHYMSSAKKVQELFARPSAGAHAPFCHFFSNLDEYTVNTT
jgi:hypothetical protein